MAGVKIIPVTNSPNHLYYSNRNTSGYPPLTDGLLNAFTEVTGVLLTGGEEMSVDLSSSDYCFRVASGTYSDNYFINRNDPVGEAIWSNINNAGDANLRIGDFYDYHHWPPDNRCTVLFDNSNPMEDVTLDLKIFASGGVGIYNWTIPASGGTFNPSGGALQDYASQPGSSGFPYSAPSVNTDWFIQITVTSTPATVPVMVTVDIQDFHNGHSLYNNAFPLDPSNGWAFVDNWRQLHYSAFSARVMCT
jgi:hypothetical protein